VKKDATACPQAMAATRHQTNRFGQVAERRHRETAPRRIGSHAAMPANARLDSNVEPTRDTRIRPPTVATARDDDSPLRNQYMPSPAMIGCRTMNVRIAVEHDRVPKTSIANIFIQPDTACAAN